MSETIYIGTETLDISGAAVYTFNTTSAEGYSTNKVAEWIQGISITNNTDEIFAMTLKTSDLAHTFLTNTRLLPRSTLQVFNANDKLQLEGKDLRFTLLYPSGQLPSSTGNSGEVVAAITYKFSRSI